MRGRRRLIHELKNRLSWAERARDLQLERADRAEQVLADIREVLGCRDVETRASTGGSGGVGTVWVVNERGEA